MPPATKFATLTSWSYSTYSQYCKCALSVLFDKVMRVRIQEPAAPPLVKGNLIHDTAEGFVSGRVKTVKPPTSGARELTPAEAKIALRDAGRALDAAKPRLQALKKSKAKVELDWAFTKAWMPTRWNDWAGAWLRMKVDVCDEKVGPPPLVHIIDWKSGKVYDDHKQQRSLYALGALRLIELGELAGGDKTTKVIAEHAYLDTSQSATEEFTLKDLKSLKREWLTRIKQMMSDTLYRPNVGFHCRYCKFRKSNGGPCPEEQ